MKEKYVIRDFHPLVFFYAFGFLMTLIGLALGILETVLRLMGNDVSVATRSTTGRPPSAGPGLSTGSPRRARSAVAARHR